MKTSVLMRIVGIVCIAAVGLTVWCCGEGETDSEFVQPVVRNYYVSRLMPDWYNALSSVDCVMVTCTIVDTSYSGVITHKTDWGKFMRGLRELREKYDESR